MFLVTDLAAECEDRITRRLDSERREQKATSCRDVSQLGMVTVTVSDNK